jgi:hypothetical protein
MLLDQFALPAGIEDGNWVEKLSPGRSGVPRPNWPCCMFSELRAHRVAPAVRSLLTRCLLGVMLGLIGATLSKSSGGSSAVKLRFLGKDSTPTNSPTLYATDQDSYVVQGWNVTDAATLARLVVPEGETVVEVPAALLTYLVMDGLNGVVTNPVPPIVGVTDSGNYIIQGKQVTDTETLSQMSIPPHETCVHVTRPAMLTLVEG